MSTPTHGHASLLGATFAGYRVVGLIGRGAMGAVYLAQDTSLDRPVALKVLLGSLAKNPAMVENFKHEARTAAPLRHPNIVRIYNAGIAHGTPFLAMEYVEGEPLDRFLRRKGQVPWQTALFIGEQVADALFCAHQAGVVHRDVKPANILLDRSGRARLTDFGIANMHQADAGDKTDEAFIGTPHYMSPEQCSGGNLSPVSDLFSLGVMLYRMIGGALPFDAESPLELIKKINSHDPPRLNRIVPEVPDDVARAIAHLMSKRPEQRPDDAASVRDVFHRLQAEKGGRSALPTALAAFIAEQAEIRPIRGLSAAEKSRTLGQSRTRTWAGWYARHRSGITIAAAMVIGIAGGALAVMAWRPAPAVLAAPKMATFASQGEQPVTLTVASGSYSVGRLFPAGSSRICALVDGRPGSIVAGAQGIATIDPREGTVLSVHLPVSAAIDAPNLAAPQPIIASYASSWPDNPGVSDEVRIPIGAPDATSGRLTLVSRPATVANGGTAAGSVGAIRAALTGSPQVYLAMHPDGVHYASIDHVGETGTLHIVERNGSEPREGVTRRVVPGQPLIPGSFGYAMGGRAMYFQVYGERGQRELWAQQGESAAVPLTIGNLATEVAVSPDGQRLAIGVSIGNNKERGVRLIDMESGESRDLPASGTPGTASWFAPDRMAVTALDEETGVQQVWIVNAVDGSRTRLTGLPEGVTGSPAATADGAWLAVAAAGVDARVVLWPLSGARQ